MIAMDQRRARGMAQQRRLFLGAPSHQAGGVGGQVVGHLLRLAFRLDPREALPAITAHLGSRGVRVMTSTSVLGVDERGVSTSRGRIDASAVVVAVGHDVDQLFPDLAAAAAGALHAGLDMEMAILDPAFDRLPDAVAAGALRVGAEAGLPITRFPLERTADAHAAVAAGAVGKVLVDL